MLVGAFHFPTDYGIEISELARALEARGFESSLQCEGPRRRSCHSAPDSGSSVTDWSRHSSAVPCPTRETAQTAPPFHHHSSQGEAGLGAPAPVFASVAVSPYLQPQVLPDSICGLSRNEKLV